MTTSKELINNYETSINNIIAEFEKKHGVVAELWIGDDVGGVCNFGDYYLNFSDILIDLKSDAPLGEIFKWYNATLNQLDKKRKVKINYDIWIMGLNYSNSDTKMIEIVNEERILGCPFDENLNM